MKSRNEACLVSYHYTLISCFKTEQFNSETNALKLQSEAKNLNEFSPWWVAANNNTGQNK